MLSIGKILEGDSLSLLRRQRLHMHALSSLFGYGDKDGWDSLLNLRYILRGYSAAKFRRWLW